LILLTVCHSGCGYIAPVIKTDQFYVNYEDQYCYRRDYIFSPGFVGPTGEAERLPIGDCSGVVGFMPKAWGRILSVLWNEYQEQVPKENNKMQMRRDLDYNKINLNE